MMWQDWFGAWLMHSAVGGTILLGITAAAVAYCRQPARKLRLIEFALLACLVAPWFNMLPALPHWSLGFISPRGEASPPSQARPTASDETPVPAAVKSVASDTAREQGTSNAAPSLPLAPQSPANSSGPALFHPIVALYAAVVFGCVARWLLGVAAVLRLKQSARLAPETVRRLFDEIVGRAGQRVRLMESQRVELPIMFGVCDR